MDTDKFREYGKIMIDYICDYVQNISSRDVYPTIDPGYLKPLIPDEPPLKGEDFNEILKDVENKIMPGIVHWNHPKFFAYFPSGNSFPSLLGDLLSSAIGSIGFSWASCPAATELETIVLDWYAKALNLPNFFLNDHPESIGGGAIQGSASECALVCMIAARARAIKELKGDNNDIHDSVFLPQLVAYSSKDAHSSIEKAAKMALVKLRILDTDTSGRFRSDVLRNAMNDDIKNGLKPFFVVATVGTTAACAFDNLSELGETCRDVSNMIWFHVDGAYAGNSFILPEMRRFSNGLEYADSFNTNPNKLFLTNFDCSALWVKDIMAIKTALSVNPLYLQHEHDKAIDYRHYSIPLSRRFRALKLWFVFRSYGLSAIQAYIRNHIRLAKKFEKLVLEDERFEVRNDVHLGLVCFRLKSSDQLNRDLLALINHSGKMHMTPAMVKGKYVIRFCVTYEWANDDHIDEAWQLIKTHANDLMKEQIMHNLISNRINDQKPSTKRKLTRTMSSRFSFTRSVSKEIYERQASKSNLTDGCTPIMVLDTDDIANSFNDTIARQIENGDNKSKNNINHKIMNGNCENENHNNNSNKINHNNIKSNSNSVEKKEQNNIYGTNDIDFLKDISTINDSQHKFSNEYHNTNQSNCNNQHSNVDNENVFCSSSSSCNKTNSNGQDSIDNNHIKHNNI